METFLNLAWAALSVAMICAWLRMEDGSDRRRQFIGVLVLIAILLPVISVSDDLLALQNATETDTVQRRDQLLSPALHALTPPAVAALPGPLFQGVAIPNLGYMPPRSETLPSPAFPGLPAIQNRPPPAA